MTDMNDINEKKYQEDKAFIKSMFDNDGVEVPEGLSADSIKGKLAGGKEVMPAAGATDGIAGGKEVMPADGATDKAGKGVKQGASPAGKIKPARKRIWIRSLGLAAAAAACFFMVFNPLLKARSVDAESLEQFTSYKAINKTIENLTESSFTLYGVQRDVIMEESEGEGGIQYKAFDQKYGAASPGAKSNDSAAKAPTADAPGMSSPLDSGQRHTDTYLQVEGVDEADVVKVDNDHIYFIDSSNMSIRIYKAVSGKTVKESVIKAEKKETFWDIFLRGDRLVAVSESFDSQRIGGEKTLITVYDISDRRSPEKVSQYAQSGSPVSQRMVDDIVYLVTDKYAVKNDFPICGSPKKEKKLAPSDISCIPRPITAEYTIIGAVDTSTGKELSHVTKAILGGSQDIYANGDNLYIAGKTYAEGRRPKSDDQYRWLYDGRAMRTCIIKVRMAEGDLKVLSTATIPGMIDDQFAMDEKDGNFRIATTSFQVDENGDTDNINNLFILDENLKELGKVTGFAKGESIKAVKYLNDTAYVITYEETDPLFVIDLSNSRKPKIMGEAKISGFSTLLLPLDDNKLLGIGYSTSGLEDIDMEATDGLKFALFDVSDPLKPEVIDSKELKNIYSEVQEDHRALTVLGNGSYIIPCYEEHYTKAIDDGEEFEEYDDTTGHAYIISASDRITIDDHFETEDEVDRCPVIDGYAYAILSNDKVVSHKLK